MQSGLKKANEIRNLQWFETIKTKKRRKKENRHTNDFKCYEDQFIPIGQRLKEQLVRVHELQKYMEKEFTGFDGRAKPGGESATATTVISAIFSFQCRN